MASAPCCLPSLNATVCLGVPNQFCPPGRPGPPGGPGAGTTPNFDIPAGTTMLYATAFGVCGGTVNAITLTGANGGQCPA